MQAAFEYSHHKCHQLLLVISYFLQIPVCPNKAPAVGLMFLPPLSFCPFFTPQEFGSTKSITSRCDFLQNLIANGCDGAIENPSSSINVVKNVPLSSKGSGQTHLDVTQIMPQKVALSLRPGESPRAVSDVLGCVCGGEKGWPGHAKSVL